MFKKMGLAGKLAFGFGVVVLITLILGGIAIINMTKVKNDSIILIKEKMPEVTVANNLERTSLETMFQMRGYVMSYDEKFLEEGRQKLEAVKQYIKQAKQHGDTSARLANLRKAAAQAEEAAEEYERLADETASQITLMKNTLKDLINVGERYVAACNNFINNQNQAVGKEVDSGSNDKVALKEHVTKLNLAHEVLTQTYMIRKSVWESLAQKKPQVMEEAGKKFALVEEQLNAIKAITKKETDLKEIETIRQAKQDYIAGMTILMNALIKVNELDKTRGAASAKVLNLAKDTATLGLEDTTKTSADTARSLSVSSVILIVGLVIGIVLAVLLASVITRGITLPINRIVSSLNEGSEQTSAAASQVSSASQQLSQGATEQAASIEETSSSLDEMASMTRQNADNASRANQLAQDARSSADVGNQAMEEMQTAMGAINESSDQISRIIKNIEEIAFQTNLLALNAAVEAARAGEHGKGFAVVAEEVRNLARRSADSAKDTANLIENSIDRVKHGTDVASKAGEALKSIRDNSKKVADIIGEIAAASKEQSEGISQITTAVSQMDQVTQQNASAAEECASAAEELSSQAETLKGMVHELDQIIVGSSKQLDDTGFSHKQLAERRTHAPVAKPLPNKRTNAPKVIKPEDTIPFDDDKVIKQF